MKIYLECLNLVIEICIAIFMIIYGYFMWNNFDNSEYEMAQEYVNNIEYYTNK